MLVDDGRGPIVKRRVEVRFICCCALNLALLRCTLLLGAANVQRQRIVRVMILQVIHQRAALLLRAGRRMVLISAAVGVLLEGRSSLGCCLALQRCDLIAQLGLIQVQTGLAVLLHV